MKVKELIKLLEACPSDYEVLLADINNGSVCPIIEEDDKLVIRDEDRHVVVYWYDDVNF